MNLFNLFSKKKERHEYCHLRNLFILANVDNVILNEELQCITEVMVRESLTEADAEKVIVELKKLGLLGRVNGNYQKINVVAPPNKDKALVYMQDMISVMLVDGNIDKREKEFCKYVAMKYGFNPSIIDLMIPFIINKASALSNIIDNADNSLIEDGLDIIANSEDEESARQNFAGYLVAKQNPKKALQQITEKMIKTFEDDLNEIIRSGNGDSLTLGLMGQASVVENIKILKSSSVIQILSGLNKADFDKLVDSIATEVLTKYFE